MDKSEKENQNFDFFKVISSDEDMLKYLMNQSGDLNFFEIKFKVDIDLYTILLTNPIPGITLLERPIHKSKPAFLKKHSPVFDCSDSQFDKPVKFFGCHFDIYVEFTDVIFSQGFSFKSSNFEKGLSLLNVPADGNSTFGFNSGSSVLMINNRFDVIDNQNSELYVEGSFNMTNTAVNSDLDLSRSKITDQLNLIGIKLYGNLDLSLLKVKDLNIHADHLADARCELQDLNILEAEFLGHVHLSNLNINGTVRGRGAIFKESIFFTNLNFNKDAYFTHTIIDKPIYLENVCSKGNFSFYGSTFNANIHFNEIDFSIAHVSFTGSRINADLWVGSLLHKDSTNFSGTLSFQGAIIAATSIVRIFNLNDFKSPAGEIDFSNALIRGLLDVRNVYIEKITFNGTVVSGNIHDDNSLQLAIVDRNTARLLKHEAHRINNSISALSYKKIEMSLYAKTLSLRKFSDWSMLKLNWISNRYGSNWLWGAGFTISCGLICYSIFNISVFGFRFIWHDNWNFIYNDEQFWSGFINYFWLPTGFNELIKDGTVQGGILGGLVFIIGKILIAYGIYQTVAAFRKYV